VVAWVVFRAPDLTTAGDILRGMAGGNGIALPHGLAAYAPYFHGGAQFSGIRWIDFSGVGVLVLALAMPLAFLAPNTQEIFRHHAPCAAPQRRLHWSWRPRKAWSLAFSLLFLGCLFSMNRVSEFLYFQF